MAGHKRCYTVIEPIHLGETRELARRNFLRSAMVLVSALPCMPTPAAQDNRQGSVHPPEPAGQEFDMLQLPNSRSPNRPVPDLRGRSQEFSRCLDQLFTGAARLRQEISELPLTEVFSVQVYKRSRRSSASSSVSNLLRGAEPFQSRDQKPFFAQASETM